MSDIIVNNFKGVVKIMADIAMIKWISTDSAKYLALGTKDVNALYWLEDTKEIYKGVTPYTESTVFYATTLPVRGAQGKIYIKSTTLKGSIWNGSAWVDIIQPIAQTVDVANTNAAVSGKAVVDYVAAQGASIAAQAVTAIVYDATNKAIKFTKNGEETSLALTKLGTVLAYDGATGVVTLKDQEGTNLSTINIPLDNFVQSGVYNATTKALELTMQNGGVVSIPAADLVRLYDADDTSSVDVTIETTVEGNNVIRATVKLSATANNALVLNADGLYVDKEALLKVAEPTSENNLLIVGADGHTTDSGVQISTIATNIYVDGIKAALELSKVSVTDIITSAAAINTLAPSEVKVVSEKTLTEIMSWSVL